MRILGIETSCDETAAAIVQDGRIVLSTIIASSKKEQELYGGVFPEVAARRQLDLDAPRHRRGENDRAGLAQGRAARGYTDGRLH